MHLSATIGEAPRLKRPPRVEAGVRLCGCAQNIRCGSDWLCRVLGGIRWRRRLFACLRSATVETKCSGAERDNLKETASHGDVLQEVNHLILVCEVMMEAQRRRHTEDSHDERGEPGLQAQEEEDAAADFDDDGDEVSEHRSRQSSG